MTGEKEGLISGFVRNLLLGLAVVGVGYIALVATKIEANLEQTARERTGCRSEDII